MNPLQQLYSHGSHLCNLPRMQVREIWLSSEDTGAYGAHFASVSNLMWRHAVLAYHPSDIHDDEDPMSARPTFSILYRYIAHYISFSVLIRFCGEPQQSKGVSSDL